MKIAVDIRALKDNTGVTRHLKSFLDKLQFIDNDNSYFLFSNKKISYQITNPRWNLIFSNFFIPGTLWLQFVLPLQVKKYKIDLFWGADQICPMIKMNCKTVVSIYDLVYKHFPNTMKSSVRIISQMLIPFSMKSADAIIATSNFIKEDILTTYPNQYCKEKIHIIPCGRPEWELPESMKCLSHENYLLFVGNLEPRKNLSNLITALEILHARNIIIPLHLVGPRGWENSELFRKIELSSIKSQIHITGYLSEAALIEEYAKCKALIFPSVYEGFGLPVLEALYLNRIVITSEGTVMEEVAGCSAIYCDPYNPDSIAEKIEQIYSKQFDEMQYSEPRKKILKKYDWMESSKKLLFTFNEITAHT
jgi:glycosyltransferase involved in cell wall biosynthesis